MTNIQKSTIKKLSLALGVSAVAVIAVMATAPNSHADGYKRGDGGEYGKRGEYGMQGEYGMRGNYDRHDEMQARITQLIDANGDGEIGDNEASLFIKDVVSQYDSDKTESLNESEIITAMNGLRFDFMDPNQDGVIDRDEFGAHFNNNNSKMRGFSRMMKQFDEDDDSQLSIAELQDFLSRFID